MHVYCVHCTHRKNEINMNKQYAFLLRFVPFTTNFRFATICNMHSYAGSKLKMPEVFGGMCLCVLICYFFFFFVSLRPSVFYKLFRFIIVIFACGYVDSINMIFYIKYNIGWCLNLYLVRHS